MVSSVNTSSGSSAYLNSSKLAGGNASNVKRQIQPTSEQVSESSGLKSSEKTQKSTETRDAAPVAANKNSQLESRNDSETLQTEQTRGSLLDLAV